MSDATSFNGERLREARRARGMTLAQLAEEVGVTTAAVSGYETGRTIPPIQRAEEIARAIDFPLSYLMRPSRIVIADRALFFRSMKSATKRAREQSAQRFEWLSRLVDHLYRAIEMPTCNLPKFRQFGDPERISDEYVEQAATEARRHMRLGEAPIANATWALEHFGVLITSFDLRSEQLDAFSSWSSSGRPIAVLNATRCQAASRYRFSLAHEVGHLLLHQDVSTATLSDPVAFDRVEAQAHRFASAFLLPERSFTADIPRRLALDSLMNLKAKWNVSAAAMIMRLYDLGIVDAEQRQRLYVNLSRRGWRLKEPLDDQASDEKPHLIPNAVKTLRNGNLIAFSQMQADLALRDDDLFEITGLQHDIRRPRLRVLLD